MINIEKLITDTTATICKGMGLEGLEMPPAETLRYFRFQEIPFLLFFIAKKTHRTTIKQVQEQYELATGQEMTYEGARHLVRRFYDEVERVKMMEGKAKQN